MCCLSLMLFWWLVVLFSIERLSLKKYNTIKIPYYLRCQGRSQSYSDVWKHNFTSCDSSMFLWHFNAVLPPSVVQQQCDDESFGFAKVQTVTNDTPTAKHIASVYWQILMTWWLSKGRPSSSGETLCGWVPRATAKGRAGVKMRIWIGPWSHSWDSAEPPL